MTDRRRFLALAGLAAAGMMLPRRVLAWTPPKKTPITVYKSPSCDCCGKWIEHIAANGFGDPGEPWISMTGTSMASPYVAGVEGLMLAADPRLTAAQILGILKATAQPLPGGTYQWVNDCGFGVITPEACVGAAKIASQRHDVKGRFP